MQRTPAEIAEALDLRRERTLKRLAAEKGEVPAKASAKTAPAKKVTSGKRK